jgi:hypothetical protein
VAFEARSAVLGPKVGPEAKVTVGLEK